jgi:Zn finger protein HypA/HybF involved in hydrogenase expression
MRFWCLCRLIEFVVPRWAREARARGYDQKVVEAAIRIETRRGQLKHRLTIQEATALAEEEASIWCQSCSAPADGQGRYCRHCESYWADVDAGVFDGFEEAEAHAR